MNTRQIVLLQKVFNESNLTFRHQKVKAILFILYLKSHIY